MLESINLTQAEAAVKMLLDAAAAHTASCRGNGCAVRLPSRGRLVLSGDLHDHGPNLRRLVHLAQLDASPDHHLLLHELIHGPFRVNGADLSLRTLLRVAALKAAYPQQVHVVLSNHELAQMLGRTLAKDGQSVNEAFDEGVAMMYGEQSPAVVEAFNAYVRSLPLAVVCDNGLMAAHSLPSPVDMATFDTGVVHRPLTDADLAPGGSAYRMVWGRKHTPEQIEHLADAWDVDTFVLGHQPVDDGILVETDRAVILASNHDLGHAVIVDLDRAYDTQELLNEAVRLIDID